MIVRDIVEHLSEKERFELIDENDQFLPGLCGSLKNTAHDRRFYQQYLDRVISEAYTIDLGHYKTHCLTVKPEGTSEYEVKFELNDKYAVYD